MISIRRKLMAKMQSEPQAEYIQNGLVYHFVSSDSDGQTWVDRINGLTFTLANVSKAQDNGLYFNGSANGVCPDVSLPQDFTLEIVFNKIGTSSGYYILMASQKDQNIVFVTNETTFRTDIPPRNREYSYNYTSRKVTASTTNISSGQLVILNTTTLNTFNGVGIFGANYSGIQIGARATANGSFRDYGLVGELYQIRVYDRQLSEAEILVNQAIDINKYNLPLPHKYLNNVIWVEDRFINASGVIDGSGLLKYSRNAITVQSGSYLLVGTITEDTPINFRIHQYDASDEWVGQIAVKQVIAGSVAFQFTVPQDMRIRLSIAKSFTGTLIKQN